MEVTVTQFRQNIFDLVNQAGKGVELWITYKGRRFKLTPETAPSRLSRITPLEIINPESSEADVLAMKEEMQQAWEADWAEL